MPPSGISVLAGNGAGAALELSGVHDKNNYSSKNLKASSSFCNGALYKKVKDIKLFQKAVFYKRNF